MAERKQKCVIGVYCREHGMLHGSEAEELRKGLERLLQDGDVDAFSVQCLLDSVDARDSLAFVESGARTPKPERTPLQRIPPGYEIREMPVLVKRDG